MVHGRRRLREWLDRSHKKQNELAAQIGVTDGYLSQILSGLRRPKLEILIAIETETGVPVESWVDTQSGKTDQRRSA
jgi:transcriptional regulator with XRE-family HTH domain